MAFKRRLTIDFSVIHVFSVSNQEKDMYAFLKEVFYKNSKITCAMQVVFFATIEYISHYLERAEKGWDST